MKGFTRSSVVALALIVLCVPIQAQRFIKVVNNIAGLVAANPNDIYTNVFVVDVGEFYTWNSASTDPTNANLSVLKATSQSTGRWFLHSAGGSAGVTNIFEIVTITNLFVQNTYVSNIVVTNLTVLNTNTFITNFFFNNTYITNISQGDNWTAEGETNSTLPGIGRLWKLVATNSGEFGQTGDTPIIELVSPNGTYTNRISLNNSGLMTVTNNGAAVFTVNPTADIISPGGQGSIKIEGATPANDYAILTDNAIFIEKGGTAVLSMVPTAANGSAFVYRLDTSVTHTNGDIVQVLNSGAERFNILFDTGWTGTGTNVFTDGGYFTNFTSGGASDNWVALGATNSYLVGNGYVGFALLATNNGSASSPTFGWVSDLGDITGGVGMYRDIQGEPNFSIAGDSHLRISTSGLNIRPEDQFIWRTGSPDSTSIRNFIGSGTGSPEGNVTGNVGSMWLRTDGSYGSVLYLKESGSGDTGWSTYAAQPTNYVTVALSNPNSAVTTGNTNFWVAPEAVTIKTVTAHLLVPSSSGSVTLELKKNGTTVLSAPVSLTSGTTNATASLSVTAVSALDRLAGEITAAGTTAYGAQLKIGYTTP